MFLCCCALTVIQGWSTHASRRRESETTQVRSCVDFIMECGRSQGVLQTDQGTPFRALAGSLEAPAYFSESQGNIERYRSMLKQPPRAIPVAMKDTYDAPSPLRLTPDVWHHAPNVGNQPGPKGPGRGRHAPLGVIKEKSQGRVGGPLERDKFARALPPVRHSHARAGMTLPRRCAARKGPGGVGMHPSGPSKRIPTHPPSNMCCGWGGGGGGCVGNKNEARARLISMCAVRELADRASCANSRCEGAGHEHHARLTATGAVGAHVRLDEAALGRNTDGSESRVRPQGAL